MVMGMKIEQAVPKRAICLLSGGIDSATAAAIAKADGYEVYALTIHYGQRHSREVRFAEKLAMSLKLASHTVLNVNLRAWGGSALTDSILVPHHETIGNGIPVTYVPARNLILLSLAVGYAEASGASRVYFGANSLDYSGYPDCRPAFLEAFAQAATLGTKTGVEGDPIEIVAPLQHMTKAEIIQRGLDLNVNYKLTRSCYEDREQSCGKCDSCRIRLAAFETLGIRDPIEYENH
jgi:7-cyano-7-deazaguanine synthase